MPRSVRKRTGSKATLILLSILLFLMLFPSFASAAVLGDVNEDGKIDVLDVVLIMQDVLEIKTLDEDKQIYADVNGDGKINVLDVTLVLQYVLNLIDEFPAELLVIESVHAINRTTIEVTLAEGTDSEIAEEPNNYLVTVGGEAVEVENADYVQTTNVANLDVDLVGLSGECIVNGVTAEVSVPPLPLFESIETIPGGFKIVLKFNTAVYDLNDNLLPGDFTVTTDGNNNTVLDVEAATAVETAESIITLTLDDPTVGGTLTSVTLTAAGAAKVVNIWDEAAAFANRSHSTPVDTEAPEFTGVRAIEGGYTIILDFSEPVHTGGVNLTASDAFGQDVRVTVNGVRVAVQGNIIEGIVAQEATDSIKVDLDLALADLLSAGDTVIVTLDASLLDDAVGRNIVDLSSNQMEGDRVREALFEAGPGLVNASASDLAISDEAVQTFTFILDGELEDTNEIIIDVSDAAASVLDAYEAAYLAGNAEVDHDDLNVLGFIFTGAFVIQATADIPDETTVVVTIEADSLLATAAEDVEVIFQRRDFGTTAADTFSVNKGFSNLNVNNLVSGLEEQDMGTDALAFQLEGNLAAGGTVTINLSSLVNAGVDFSAVDATNTVLGGTAAGDFDFSMTGAIINLTATADIPSKENLEIGFRDTSNSPEVIDVDPGATGIYQVTFARNDSPVVGEIDALIEANIIDGSATNLHNNKANQIQVFTYKVDGDFAMNTEMYIGIFEDPTYILYNANIINYNVSGADAQVTSVQTGMFGTAIVVRSNEMILSGTEIKVTADLVTTTSDVNNKEIPTSIGRDDTSNFDTFKFDVGTP